jgi:hypothetical protein
MTASIEVKLKPFLVPNFANVEHPARARQDGLQHAAGIHISDLPASALRELAHDWLAGLYDKAGKPYDWRFD